MQPGSLKGLHLVVADMAEAHGALVARGVDVGEVQDMQGVLYAQFDDPDGNLWLLHPAIPSRLHTVTHPVMRCSRESSDR